MIIHFEKFPKIPRWSRTVFVTEKIDGTNASVYIDLEGPEPVFLTGSRTRWIRPEDDNFGFSKWAHEHKDELITGLGHGHHFGEWWGQGIQRRYGLTEKRFSLFNVHRWNAETKPACCHVVPLLAVCTLETNVIENAMDMLRDAGSFAAPGFMKPEGIIVYHSGSRTYFKKTFEKDQQGKGE